MGCVERFYNPDGTWVEFDYINCDGCGESIQTPRGAAVAISRERTGASSGRVMITYRNAILHMCADGSYLPPSQVAAPK